MSAVPSTAGAVLSETADRRLVSRYGAAALASGYAAIPHVVLRQRRALGISAAEWDYICELWSHWRSATLPCPSVEALAAGLGVDQSTIRRYRASLEHKGLLRVTSVGARHRYDLTPLIEAAVGLARLQAGEEARDVPRISAQAGRAEMRAKEEEVEREFDLDSMPPYPPQCTAAPSGCPPRPSVQKHAFPQGAAQGERRSEATAKGTRENRPCDPDEHALMAPLAALSAEFGDLHPRSSLSQAVTLMRERAATPAGFLARVADAAERTRVYSPTIYLCGPDGQPNAMPYLFRVLRERLDPAPQEERIHARKTGAGGSRRRGQAGDRSRRQGPQRADVTATSTGTPEAPPSITETHPVWRATLDELALMLTMGNFTTWLGTTRVVAQEGDLLRIAVPSQFTKEWLEHRLHDRVMQTLARLDYERLGITGQRVTQVEYVVVA